MSGPLVAVVDYGIGNLHSAHKSLQREGADARLTADPGLIADAVAVVLPGVGAFGACLDALRSRRLEAPVLAAVESGRPFLGVCIGTQMLFDTSEEDPGRRGLGVLPGVVRWIPPGVKRPQMQWNRVAVADGDDPMFAGLGERPWFYFVHSLYGVPDDPSSIVATCDYGGPVNAAFRAGNVFAVQFHPEKSASAGLGLIHNFVASLSVAAVSVLYPSIDLRGGHVVRLRQGDYAAETVYGDDPVAVATDFCAQGATWIHIVDLDAARTGEATNRAAVAAVAAAVAGRAAVQAGGGVRSVADAEALAGAGVARVVMGSAAVREPALVDAVAEVLAVAVGLDHHGGELAVHGWTEASGLHLTDALTRFPAAAAFVVTDIQRDGLLAGPDVDGLAAVVAATPVPVIASGGVGTLDDVRALAAIEGLHGIITGRALYEGRFAVADALGVLA